VKSLNNSCKRPTTSTVVAAALLFMLMSGLSAWTILVEHLRCFASASMITLSAYVPFSSSVEDGR